MNEFLQFKLDNLFKRVEIIDNDELSKLDKEQIKKLKEEIIEIKGIINAFTSQPEKRTRRKKEPIVINSLNRFD